MKTKLLFGAVALGATAFAAGCVASAQAGGYVDADAPVAFAEEPTLVLVEPNIWVVRDYDYAVYYVDDYYWVYRGDAWYRSRLYDRGWVTVNASVVPSPIVHRDHKVYVHYHGAANAQTRKAPHERVAEGDHDRSRQADEHRNGPPGQDKDKDRGPPEHANDHRGHPPGQDKDKDRGPPEHANDHRGEPPGQDRDPGPPAHGNDHDHDHAGPGHDGPGHDGPRGDDPRDDKRENRANDEKHGDEKHDKKHGDEKHENGKK